MSRADFYKRQIEEWQKKSKEASRNADLKAFDIAESEIATYQKLLESVK